MKKLFLILTFMLIFSSVNAGDFATEAQVKAAFKILIKNQHVKLNKSELCKQKPPSQDKTIGDLLASTMSYAVTEKGHKTNLSTRCEKVSLKEKGKQKQLLDCEMSIYMESREGASSSFRFAVDIENKSLIEDSIRCF